MLNQHFDICVCVVRHQMRLLVLTVGLLAALPAAAQIPAGWEVTGFGRGRAATDQTVEYESGRWMVKTGPSRSAIVHQTHSGDITLTAQFLEASGPNTAQIGLMLWATVSQTAGNLGLVLDPQGQKLTLLWDESSDRVQMSTDSIQLDGIGFPVWLRLTRTGSYFHAFYSRDGADWRQVGLPVKTFWAGSRPEIFAGLYAAGDAQQRVSHLTITPAVPTPSAELPAGWSTEVRGQPNFIGHAAFTDGKFILSGAATRGRGGYFGVSALQATTNRVQITGAIRLADLVDARSAGGLVLSSASMEAGIMIAPTGGQLRWFTRRKSDGRFVQNRTFPLPANLVGQTEAQLRLAVVESRVAAFQRGANDDWVQVGDVITVPELVDDIRAGVELYSESASRSTLRVSFESVEIGSIASLPVRPPPAATPSVTTAPATTVAASRPPTAPTYTAPAQQPRRSGSGLAWVFFLLKFLFWTAVIGAVLVARPFNRLVKLRNHMRKGWAQIDVQLKRRHDLIQNVVETVKGYAKHEQSTLEGVTRARAAAVSAQSPSDRAAAEEALNSTMRSLYAVVESYPELKANQNFATLQQNLTTTEDKIATARHNYNEEVVNYNTAVESFPTNIVAFIFRFRPGDFFELKTDQEREVTSAKLSP